MGISKPEMCYTDGTMTPFDLQYREAIRRIMEDGVEERHERTGTTTRALPGVTFQIDLEEGFPLLTLRKIPVKLFVAEQVWFVSGERQTSHFLRDFTKIFDDFAEEDGTISTAYGYRWRHHFGRDQLMELVRHLEAEPTSRHGVVVTWDPSDDGLTAPKKKNVPCPFTYVVNIIGGRLNLHNVVRSNDMMLGCPHDAAGFALLAYLLAQKLGVRPGMYTHSISHAHVYGDHFEHALELLSHEHDHPAVKLDLPPNSFDRALRSDKNLVQEIFEILSSQYQPCESKLGRMKIAL